jgi:voltage-gated potassium channel Kch
VEDEANPVIIAGYGRFGQIVGRLLRAAGYSATLLDHDAGQIELTARFGNRVFYGDAARADLLEAAGARNARLLVVAIDDADRAVRVVETAKQRFPHLKVLARAQDRPHTYRLIRAGVDYFARETFGSALAVGEEALRMLGVPEDRARNMARRFEQHDTEGLLKLYEVWGDDEAYGFRVRQNLDELAKVLQDDAEDEAAADGQPGGADPARSV